MTRFARARGSKSCNVKQPEEPTSWAQMKKAMEAQHSKQENYSSARAALDSVKNHKDDSDKPTVWSSLENDDASNALGFFKSQLEKRRKLKNSPDVKKEKKLAVNKSYHFKAENHTFGNATVNRFESHQDFSDKRTEDKVMESNDPSNALGFLKLQLEKRKKNKDLPTAKNGSATPSHSKKESNFEEPASGSLKNHQHDSEKPSVNGLVESKPLPEKKKKNKNSLDVKKEKKDVVNKPVDLSLKKGNKRKAKKDISGNAMKKNGVTEKTAVEKIEMGKKDSVALSVNKNEKITKKQKFNDSLIENNTGENVPTKELKKSNDTCKSEEIKNESLELSTKKKGRKRKLKEGAVNNKEQEIPENKTQKLEEQTVIKEGEQKTENNSLKKKKKRKHEGTSEDSSTTQAKKKKFSTKNQGNKSTPFKKSKKPQKNSPNKQERREKLKNLTPEQRRRKPLPQTSEIFVNGESVKLQMFDGFFVTQEDAERLTKLKDDMFKKGLPFKDIKGAIKLERRRAEKALARLKKKVCFHCRKSGHALSECPEIIDSHEKAMNICYKCGSTEHTAYNCKVTHGNQFRFAECFICKEQGHIAKQCPDNPKGLYPRGGACKQCGDVTHLKKDCPQLIEKKEEMTITAGLRDDRMIEVLDEDLMEKRINDIKPTIKPNKHVKF